LLSVAPLALACYERAASHATATACVSAMLHCCSKDEEYMEMYWQELGDIDIGKEVKELVSCT